MDDKEIGQFSGVDGVICRDEDALFQQSIHDDQDDVKAGGQRKFLDEVHGDGVPGLFWDWELLQESIGLVTLQLGSHTGGAGLAVVLNEGAEEQPSVVIMDELKGFVLAEVSGDRVVVFVEKDAELEVI